MQSLVPRRPPPRTMKSEKKCCFTSSSFGLCAQTASSIKLRAREKKERGREREKERKKRRLRQKYCKLTFVINVDSESAQSFMHHRLLLFSFSLSLSLSLSLSSTRVDPRIFSLGENNTKTSTRDGDESHRLKKESNHGPIASSAGWNHNFIANFVLLHHRLFVALQSARFREFRVFGSLLFPREKIKKRDTKRTRARNENRLSFIILSTQSSPTRGESSAAVSEHHRLHDVFRARACKKPLS
jgi:hypothetical protein